VKRILLILVLLFVITAIGAVSYLVYSYTRKAPVASEIVPSSTLLFANLPNFPKSQSEFFETEAYQLFQEPEIQALISEPLELFRELLTKQETDEELLKLLVDIFQGEIFFAITHVNIIPAPDVGVAIGADTKLKKIQAAALLVQLEKELKEGNPNAQFETKKHLGIKYSVWELTPNYPICQTFLNSMMVLTLGETTMHDVIDRFKGKAETPSLSGTIAYENVINRMPIDHELFIYFNANEITQLLAPILAMVPQGMSTIQKLQGILSSGGSVTFEDSNVKDVMFIATKEGSSKAPASSQQKILELTSPDTSLYFSKSANLSESYDALMESLSQAGNPVITARATAFERSLRRVSLRIREDILASLGPEFAVIGRWKSSSLLPELALVTEIKKGTNVRPAIDTTFDVLKDVLVGIPSQLSWTLNQANNEIFHVLQPSIGPIAPTYVTTDKYLIIGLSQPYVQELVSKSSNPGPTLTQDPDYQATMNRLPNNGHSYSYCNLTTIFEPLYALAKNQLTKIAPADNAYLDFRKLPQAETISKHLSPLGAVSVHSAEGQTTTTYSPFGTAGTFIAGAAGGFLTAQALGVIPDLASIPILSKTSSNTEIHQSPHGNLAAVSGTPNSQ